jgi:hypothetical protein
MILRLGGMLVVCLAVPLLLHYFAGAALGAVGAAAAAAFWYSQYRLPAWKERSGVSFWFVFSGYGVIGLTLLVCLGRLLM